MTSAYHNRYDKEDGANSHQVVPDADEPMHLGAVQGRHNIQPCHAHDAHKGEYDQANPQAPRHAHLSLTA
jgi:hypothetical protein